MANELSNIESKRLFSKLNEVAKKNQGSSSKMFAAMLAELKNQAGKKGDK